MALIKCPECGKEISDRAAACPNCGCPIKSISTAGTPSYAQIRVVLRTAKLTIAGQSAKQGSIINVRVNGTSNILITAWGGAVGALGSSISATVQAGHKYDLDMHVTFRGRMLYLKEVDSFI